MTGYTTITGNHLPNHPVEVHAELCPDVPRRAKAGWEIVGTDHFENRWDAYMMHNEDFYSEGGMDACYHVDFKPCCKSLPNGVWPEEFNVKPEPTSSPTASHTLVEVVDDGESRTTWECSCSKTGVSATRKGAVDGHRSHARRAQA